LSARLTARFAQLARENRAGLVAYVMASDPDHETCFEILKALPAAGVDVIELGFPFSDPMADGPAIQKAAQRALKAGGSLRKTLELASRFRAHDAHTPLILMGYANPIEQLGARDFGERAATAGVDGAIIVDLPPEEDQDTRAALGAHNLSLIRLATPTTDDARLPKVLDGVSGFLYYVAVAGVTGAKSAHTEDVQAALARIRRATDLPIAVGFGVRTPEQARAIARFADAVVVGSAFVDEIESSAPHDAPGRIAIRARALSAAIRAAREPEGNAP